MGGLLVPFGGYKGYGLATVLEVLCSVLPGAAFGLSMLPMTDDSARQDNGHFFMALDIAQWMPLREFQQRMATLLAEHRDVPLARDVERIYLPGEIEHLKRLQRLSSGIPLERHIVDALIGLGTELELDTNVFDPAVA